MPKQAIVAIKAPSSDDSPDFLGQALNISPLATKNALKRSRDEVSTPLTHMQSTMHTESLQHAHPHNRSCTMHTADNEEQTTAPTRAVTLNCNMPLDSKHTVTDRIRAVPHTLLGYLYRQLHPKLLKCWQKPWLKQQAQMLSPLHNHLLEGSLREQLSTLPIALPDQGRSLRRGHRQSLRGLMGMSQPTRMRGQAESPQGKMIWKSKPGEHQNKTHRPTTHTMHTPHTCTLQHPTA